MNAHPWQEPEAEAQPRAPEPRVPDKGTWPPAGYRSADTRASVAKIAHIVTALISLGMVAVIVRVFDLLDRADRFELSDREVDEWLEQVELISSIASWAALISFISLVAWLSRSVDNTPSLGGGIARRGPRWAIWSWFIPIVHIVMPALILRDLARRISPSGGGRGWLVLVWWLCYWGPTILGFYVAFLPIYGTDSIRELYTWIIGAQAVGALGYAVTFYVVRVLQRDAEYWHERMRADWQAAADATFEARRAEAALAAAEQAAMETAAQTTDHPADQPVEHTAGYAPTQSAEQPDAQPDPRPE